MTKSQEMMELVDMAHNISYDWGGIKTRTERVDEVRIRYDQIRAKLQTIADSLDVNS